MRRPRLLIVLGVLAAAPGLGCKKEPAETQKPAGIEASPAAPAPAAPPAAPAVEAAPAPPDPSQTVSGTIILPKARKKDVKPGDTLFIIARKAGGPPPGMLLAVQKHPVGEFPMKFSLSSRDAMIQGIPFEGVVSIAVRVDKDGDAITRKKGDVFGQANDIKVGAQDVQISLDTLQAEDQVLGAGGAGGHGHGGGAPPGHP